MIKSIIVLCLMVSSISIFSWSSEVHAKDYQSEYELCDEEADKYCINRKEPKLADPIAKKSKSESKTDPLTKTTAIILGIIFLGSIVGPADEEAYRDI